MNNIIFNEKQINAIVGSLLGDGSLTKLATPKTNSAFVKSQKLESREYLYSLYELLSPHSSSFSERVKDAGFGAGKPFVAFQTRRHEYLTDLRLKWYRPFKKVPSDLKLNPEILAWWFCDDGTNTWKCRRATIYSQSFSKEENHFLVDKLQEIGIQSEVGKTYDNSGSGCCIDFSGNGYHDLLDMIRPLVNSWECMRYKVDLHGAKRGLRRGNKSGVNGISWSESRKRWCVYIKKNGKSIGLGRFKTMEEAISARKAGEILHGFCGIGRASALQ